MFVNVVKIMAAVRSIASLAELRPLINSAQLTVVDAFAQWCGPCKMIAPQVHELAMRKPHVQFAKVDVDESSDFAQEFQIRAMPTFLFFQSGQLVNRFEGADIRRLEGMVDQLSPERPTIPDDATLEAMKPKQLLTLMAQHSISSLGLHEKKELIDELKAHRKTK